MAKPAKPYRAVRTRNQALENEATRVRLRDLDARLDAVRERRGEGESEQDEGGRGAALGMAFRLATELVAAVVVCGFIGWWLDKWLDTTPLLLLVFFGLGFVVGVLNVIRTARAMQARAGGPTGQDLGPDDDDD